MCYSWHCQRNMVLRLCVFCMNVVVMARADVQVVDGVRWTYRIESGEVCVENRTGASSDDFTKDECAFDSAVPKDVKGTLTIPDELGGCPVARIGKLAFVGCNNIHSVVFPKSLKEVNYTAFASAVENRGYRKQGSTYKYEWIVYEPGTNITNALFTGMKPVCTASDISSTSDCCVWIGHSRPSEMSLFAQQTKIWFYKENVYAVDHELSSLWKYRGDRTLKIVPYVDFSPGSRYVYTGELAVTLSSTNVPCVICFTTNQLQSVEAYEEYEGPLCVKGGRVCVNAYAKTVECPFIHISQAVYGYDVAAQPTILLNGEKNRAFSGTAIVSIETDTLDGEVRYTTNGDEVSEYSPVYIAPFEIAETVYIRARTYHKDWVESLERSRTFTRMWYTNETPVIEAAETFAGVSQSVTLSCETDGATIYYTIDGSEPSAANGRVYKGPFDIYQTTTVKAVAVKDDWKDSAVASATFTKENALSEGLNCLNILPDNDATAPWTVDATVSHDGVSSVKSGAIAANGMTGLQLSVKKAGRLSFWWRAKCEEPDPEDGSEGYYDYAALMIDGVDVAYLAGEDTGWQLFVTNITAGGKHVVRWEYRKDGATTTPPDCVWVDQVQWLSASATDETDHTLTTETPVPYAWLDKYGLGSLTDFETAVKAKSGKVDGAGRELTVEEEYVAGTDPTNMTSKLQAFIDMSEGTPKVSWEPDLNEKGTKSLRDYKVWGKKALGDGAAWEYPTNSLHRFFKVTVEMP